MMHEEVAKYRELSGDTNPNTPISRIGGYLDGYEKALEQGPKWIPVSERLPEEPNVYTVTDSKGDVVRFVFDDTESSREYWLRCAKAWMFIEPYTEDGENGGVSEQEPVLDNIKGYIDHIRNTGMGKKKSLEFIEKFIEGLQTENEG